MKQYTEISERSKPVNSEEERADIIKQLFETKHKNLKQSDRQNYPHVLFKNNPSDDVIFKTFRETEKHKTGEKLSDVDLQSILQKMREGPANYGFIDLHNIQHQELFYHYILHQSRLHSGEFSSAGKNETSEINKAKLEWEKEKLLSPDPQNTYKTAYLGAGASIGYYIESLGKHVDHSASMIIGMPQPWSRERGPGKIVQPEHIITPKRLYSIETNVNDRWTDREHFSQLLEDVFQSSGMRREQQQLTKVERTDRFYRITYGEGDSQQTIYAKEVIAGLGAGSHAIRGLKEEQVAKTKEDVETGQKRIMNMDIFTHVAQGLEPEQKRTDTVIIMVGGNGLTGSVFSALNKGYRVKWVPGDYGVQFVPGQPQEAIGLPYYKYLASIEGNPDQRRKYEEGVKHLENSTRLTDLYQDQDSNIYQNIAERFQSKTFDTILFSHLQSAAHTESGVTAKLRNGDVVTGDYLVYAMGPDLSPFQVFDEKILNDLELDLDKNQRFQQQNNETTQATLGLKTKEDPTGCSLKIIGSTAARLANRIDANHTMGHVPANLPDNAPLPDTLPSIRSSIEASNNFLPYDINERVNYSVSDRTMLAAHIASRFSAIADVRQSRTAMGNTSDPKRSIPLLDQLTERIIQSRKQRSIASSSDGLLPQGPDVLPVPPYSKQFQQYWKKALQDLNTRLKTNELETEEQ